MTRVVANRYAQSGPIYGHRVVVEQILGRPLAGEECVHHLNEIKSDNRPENLVVCPTQAYHLLLHARQRIVNAGGHPDKHRICAICRALLPKTDFTTNKQTWDGRFGNCRKCENTRRRAA